MAVIVANRVDNPDHTVVITWASVTTADSGGPVKLDDLADLVVHVVGGGTAQMQGSNDGTNFVNMGAALAADSLNAVSPIPLYLQFSTIAVATVTIILVGRRRK